ncbi:A-kinase anchor protein 14 [Oncorhynchus mykiss]|nr:A-kinase anchor protein 14 [Oncorhynchus mykiss]
MDERPSSNLSLRASEIVKNVLENARGALGHQQEVEDSTEYEFRNIEWITCKDFTIELGKVRIEEYIHTWEVHTSWLFSLVFLEETDHEFHKQYHYRAQWSIPTRRTPIPKATASVYFVIVISKIKPQTLPVEVYFLVESNRLTHRPGKTRFREKWLKDVIESKTLLQNTVDF